MADSTTVTPSACIRDRRDADRFERVRVLRKCWRLQGNVKDQTSQQVIRNHKRQPGSAARWSQEGFRCSHISASTNKKKRRRRFQRSSAVSYSYTTRCHMYTTLQNKSVDAHLCQSSRRGSSCTDADVRHVGFEAEMMKDLSDWAEWQ